MMTGDTMVCAAIGLLAIAAAAHCAQRHSSLDMSREIAAAVEWWHNEIATRSGEPESLMEFPEALQKRLVEALNEAWLVRAHFLAVYHMAHAPMPTRMVTIELRTEDEPKDLLARALTDAHLQLSALTVPANTVMTIRQGEVRVSQGGDLNQRTIYPL